MRNMYQISKSTRYCASFLVIGRARYDKLFFTLERISQHVSHHLLSLENSQLESPWTFAGFIFLLSGHTIFFFTNKSWVVATLHSQGLISIISPMQWTRMISFWRKRWLTSLKTKLWHRPGKVNNTGNGEADTTGFVKAISAGSKEDSSNGYGEISSTDKESLSEFRGSLNPVSSGCSHMPPVNQKNYW